MKFHTTILQTGKTTTGIEVPPEVVEALGGGKRPAVRVTINGATYRSSIAGMGGTSMVSLSAENRALTGAAGGDEVEVTLELDSEKREVDVPADLAEALGREAEAKRVFEGLSYSHRLQHVLAINDAKSPETRARRIGKSIEMLRSGKRG